MIFIGVGEEERGRGSGCGEEWYKDKLRPGNTKGGSITVPLTSCLSGLESAV